MRGEWIEITKWVMMTYFMTASLPVRGEWIEIMRFWDRKQN